jgi:GH25 family lysozyme M1 (1,4-beta-N-acetylmuramidase)
MAIKKVLDVSQWNGSLNWKKIAPNVDAAIIRVGYRGYGTSGTLATDPKFKVNIEDAIAAGVPVGVYWCSQAISDAEAKAEADYCYKLIKNYKITYPVYLDSQNMGPNGIGRGDKISSERRTQYGMTFLKAMENYGYTVGLYCSESWYKDKIDGEAFDRAGFEIWMAKYSTTKPKYRCDAWQYTSTARVHGADGKVDLSHFYKDYSDKRTPDAIDVTIENAIKDIGLNRPDLWESILRGKTVATAANVKALMDKYHEAVVK